jgi:hypothetical protein
LVRNGYPSTEFMNIRAIKMRSECKFSKISKNCVSYFRSNFQLQLPSFFLPSPSPPPRHRICATHPAVRVPTQTYCGPHETGTPSTNVLRLQTASLNPFACPVHADLALTTATKGASGHGSSKTCAARANNNQSARRCPSLSHPCGHHSSRPRLRSIQPLRLR